MHERYQVVKLGSMQMGVPTVDMGYTKGFDTVEECQEYIKQLEADNHPVEKSFGIIDFGDNSHADSKGELIYLKQERCKLQKAEQVNETR